MQSWSNEPDLIIHNAKIYTVDPALPHAQAVAIRKHRIYAVGNDAEIRALAGPATRTIDAQGRLVLPGLCDAHIHFFDWSVGLAAVRLADTKSKDRDVDPDRRACRRHPAGRLDRRTGLE